MADEQKHRVLSRIFWDYNLTGEELFLVVTGEKEHFGITEDKVFVRMIERLSWHKLLDVLGVDTVKRLLNKSLIAALRNKELRDRYEFIRKVLHGEAISFTGWGDAYYQQIKHTLFSDRWYRTQQTLF